MNKIDKGLQGDVTYQKSKLYPFQFQRIIILKLVFKVLCSHVPTFDSWGGVTFDPQRNHMNKIDKGQQTDAKYQNSKGDQMIKLGRDPQDDAKYQI